MFFMAIVHAAGARSARGWITGQISGAVVGGRQRLCHPRDGRQEVCQGNGVVFLGLRLELIREDGPQPFPDRFLEELKIPGTIADPRGCARMLAACGPPDLEKLVERPPARAIQQGTRMPPQEIAEHPSR